jgi:aconitase B
MLSKFLKVDIYTDKRIADIRSGEKPALTPDANAKYFAEVVIDLDLRGTNDCRSDVNADVSKDIRTILLDRFLLRR